MYCPAKAIDALAQVRMEELSHAADVQAVTGLWQELLVQSTQHVLFVSHSGAAIN